MSNKNSFTPTANHGIEQIFFIFKLQSIYQMINNINMSIICNLLHWYVNTLTVHVQANAMSYKKRIFREKCIEKK